MASNDKDQIGVRPLSVPDWGLGIVTSLPPTEIDDRAAQDILNMEHDDSGNLATRCGLTELNATTFPSRITSAHYFTSEAGEIGILFTTANKLYIVETNGSGLTELTGGLTLPNNTFWSWKTFGDLAIGCNKATSGSNPIKVNTSASAAALGGTPPKAKYIEVWNNRVWLSGASEPNIVYGSALGDAEDWTIPGSPTAADPLSIDIDPADGDQITGMFATRAALYIFKKKRIFKIVPIDPSKPATDGTNLKVEIHAQTIGCVSPYSIYPVLDDVLFLSEQGLASLSLAATTEDFRTALYSRNVAEIARTPKATEEIPCFLFDTAAQFWISFPGSISLSGQPQAYVMDYLRIDQQVVKWVRFDGLAAGTAFTSFPGANGKVYVIGAENPDGDHQLYTYVPKAEGGPYSDNGAGYTKRLVTKAYTADLPLLRKWWKRWAFGFGLLSNSAQVSIQYFFDGNLNRGGSQSFSLSGTGEGALWDEGLWDVAEWDSAVTVPKDIERRFLTNSSGQKSQDVAFIVSNGQDNEGIVIKNFMLFFSLLSERNVTDA